MLLLTLLSWAIIFFPYLFNEDLLIEHPFIKIIFLFLFGGIILLLITQIKLNTQQKNISLFTSLIFSLVLPQYASGGKINFFETILFFLIIGVLVVLIVNIYKIFANKQHTTIIGFLLFITLMCIYEGIYLYMLSSFLKIGISQGVGIFFTTFLIFSYVFSILIFHGSSLILHGQKK